MRKTMGHLLAAAQNHNFTRNHSNLLQNHSNPTQNLPLGTQIPLLSAQPGRERLHIAADLSAITITSARNDTCQLATEGGTTAGPPLHHPAMTSSTTFSSDSSRSAAAPLAGDTSVIVATTGGVHDVDVTFGMTPLCSPLWHVLHLSQDTYRTAFTEVSMRPFTSRCCLRVQFQYPMLCGNPVRANINITA